MATSSSSILSTYPPSIWDDAATSLRDNSGVALIELQESSLQDISKRAFQSTVAHLPRLEADKAQHISPSADAAHATGYHGASDASSMSRYNQYRQGLVFSDGASLLQSNDNETSVYSSLQTDLNALEDLLHSIAENVCLGIERELGLPHGWFQSHFGPTRQGSQWHIKRYTNNNNHADDDPSNLLPLHTDPSLISVVILNRPGKQEGAQGLTYIQTTTTISSGDETPLRTHVEIPYSGHAVAIVLVGSVLSHVTNNYYPACRHYVQAPTAASHSQSAAASPRMVATLFLRPARTSRLEVPPSPKLAHVTLKRNNLTFEEWNMRVSRRYMKGNGGSSSSKGTKDDRQDNVDEA